MVLLSSGQVQAVLSSAIIISFTVVLFLAGYVAQQKSVASLHTALRPRPPVPRHKPPVTPPEISHLNPTHRISRPFGRLQDRLQWQAQLDKADKPFDWNKFAYAQLVRDHSEVCNALILFSDLHRLKSPAQRLLLFPRHWLNDHDGESLDPFLETSRRLIKKASRRYRATLVPVLPNIPGKNENDPEAYSLTTLSMMEQFEKILTFTPPGLVLEASALDSILVFADTTGVAAYPALNDSRASTILINPSKSSQDLLSQNVLQDVTSDLLVENAEDELLFTTSHALRTADQHSFNATAFVESSAYIQFSDPDLPGPEYDVPYSNIVKMRPAGDDQGFLWEKMYSTFHDRRYSVCGLDLEALPAVVIPETVEAPGGEDFEESAFGKTDL